jgi:hypothetical protein
VIAHIAGVPVEEVLGPLVSTGGAVFVVARLAVARLRPRDRAMVECHNDPGDPPFLDLAPVADGGGTRSDGGTVVGPNRPL